MNITQEVVMEIDGEIGNGCCRGVVDGRVNTNNACCRAAFLVRCFLIGGSLLIGGKGGYSMEFYVSSMKGVLKEVLEGMGIKVGESGKGGLYIKDKDAICDILAVMGANRAVLRVSEFIVEREYRQGVQRRTNCDDANAGRIVEASVRQCEIVERLLMSGVIEDERLIEVANVRLHFRQDSYEELADRLGISKSTVRYRLGKLMDMGQKQVNCNKT